MALILSNAGAEELTVTTSDRQSRVQTDIDLTDVKYLILGSYVDSQAYVYVYDVGSGTWNTAPTSAYTASVSGNIMTIMPTNLITYWHYVTMS